jgi:predicted transcriptional regulator
MTRITPAATPPQDAVNAQSLGRKIALLAEVALRWGGSQRLPPQRPGGASQSGAPAAATNGSTQPDHLICLETGLQIVLLRRHLQALGLSLDDYRRKWGLAADHPTAAPHYIAARAAARARLLVDRQESVNAETQ